jgi:imidazolonepropionase-like amidohydrolase
MQVRAYTLGFTALLLTLISQHSLSQQSTAPVSGLRENAPTLHAFVGGRIVTAPGEVIEAGVIVFEDGIIQAVGANVAVPKAAKVWDMKGKTLYAGFIDAYSEFDQDRGVVSEGAKHWNSEVTPQLQLARFMKRNTTDYVKLRQQGITTQLIAPQKGIIKGVSVLVNTSEQPSGQSIVNEAVALHLRLTVPPGRGRKSYPNSPMGAVALTRQTLLDAKWYQEAWKACDADSTLPRPDRNDALTALAPYASDNQLVIVDSPNELFALRSDRLAREFGLRIALRGSGYEYRRVQEIRETGRAVILPLNFPKPPNVASVNAALDVSLEDLMHWDLAPENPKRLAESGIAFALTTHGLKEPNHFLKQIRIAVKRGLSEEAALRALTTTPAKMFAADNSIGSLQAGKLANIVVTDGNVFTEKTKVLETWIAGTRFAIDKEAESDVRGKWTLKVSGAKLLSLDVKGTPVALKASIEEYSAEPPKEPKAKAQNKKNKPADKKGKEKDDKESDKEKAVPIKNFKLTNLQVTGSFPAKSFGKPGVARLSGILSKSGTSVTLTGHVVWPDGQRVPLNGQRISPFKEKEPNDEGSDDKGSDDKGSDDKKSGDKKSGDKDDKEDADSKDESKPAENKAEAAVPTVVNFPFGAYGREQLPFQSSVVVIRNATIWTSSDHGIIEDGAIVVRNGKIVAVGPTATTKIPADAVVIEANGKFISPGIIDCHSHMATDGGVNESAQVITAEVRIGDFINSDDIDIYRQLAGGVTCSNILHGSANPIGGQNQVIKLRWGMVPEALKMSRAPQGIKFALGENVKQSNWGDEYTTRYPQTRMGVQQIMKDALTAAREYDRRWNQWNANHQGLPPRRDLELDAIAEIVAGKRWIHCHSYRQDEILTLIRTLDQFGIQIGTFQHILEGYKVADAMAKHGAMGSAFSDWWAYKFEVFDAIPYNGALMHNAGVVVSFNSDDRELARHLNQEAAKAMKYGGVPAKEALKFVTLNPAKQLRIDKYVGSLETGKDADFVIWSGPPLSNFSRCEQTWIDGRKYFDIAEDVKSRQQMNLVRNRLIQKILDSGEEMRSPGDRDKDHSELWPHDDEFCHHGHDDHGHDDHGHEHEHGEE